ncbi:hypothetical protein [Marinitenerispora sediminis]|uniref:Uncharacterized protein n=1 Tax=Marinitenerispora sediminis TaxID=1931232 RepID=A0A368T3W8_9ACTN|nr:hypothetical protein [Marinitenerispora sediminis]RCV49742.1 hypothetical protein DEF28_19950 [Marinitenerispora sediminis]RCV53556.1 hypothetical protein DEF23_17300 [Marinitenerispora sediminis]RCV57654.1 hypothetical protein DEF24_14860 [Marinitenerispora sediminis]
MPWTYSAAHSPTEPTDRLVMRIAELLTRDGVLDPGDPVELDGVGAEATALVHVRGADGVRRRMRISVQRW